MTIIKSSSPASSKIYSHYSPPAKHHLPVYVDAVRDSSLLAEHISGDASWLLIRSAYIPDDGYHNH